MAESPSLRWRPPRPEPSAAPERKKQLTMEHFAQRAAARAPPVVDPDRRTVVSLFDADGSALAPWAARGYKCIAVRHEPNPHKWKDTGPQPTGKVQRVSCSLASVRAVAEDDAGYAWLQVNTADIAFACASPPSRDLSVAGARHWKAKREKDPHFQENAVALVKDIRDIFEDWDCPYYIANPASSQLRKLWREPNYTYQPFDYGGYLDPADKHPLYPDFIPAQDAYSQQQGLWTGGGFRMPAGKPVEPEWKYFSSARRGAKGTHRRRMSPVLYSNWNARGARASTPRGFARALCQRLVDQHETVA